MKRTTPIIIAIILIVSAAAWYFLGKKETQSPAAEPPAAPQTESTGGINPAGIPSGETLSLGTPKGTITVKNFYKNAVSIDEEIDVLLRTTAQYTISYSRVDSSFQIVVLAAPVAVNQKSAEADLLSLLGVNQSSACSLKISVIIPLPIDANLGGRIYPLSFCPPTQ